MLADDVACNARNRFPATVFNNADRKIELYGGGIDKNHDGTVEVDYRGYEVTVENFIRLLTGRHSPEVPKSKRLTSDDKSNILVYMTGHGGNEFLKFQDTEEIGSHDLADAFQQMYEKRRYHEILFIVDTCQANTLYTHLYSPNIIASGSSRKGESSYSHHHSSAIGVAVIDRYTYYVLEYMEQNVVSMQSNHTIDQLFNSLSYSKLHSQHGVRTDLFNRQYEQVLLTDFFGNVPSLHLTSKSSVYDEGLTIKCDAGSSTDIDLSSVKLLLSKDVLNLGNTEFERFGNEILIEMKQIFSKLLEYFGRFKNVCLYPTGSSYALKRVSMDDEESDRGFSKFYALLWCVSVVSLLVLL